MVSLTHKKHPAMRTRILSLCVFALMIAWPGRAGAQSAEDREGVRLAVLDYVEAIYNVEPERIEQSVHPQLAKVGYWRPRNATVYQEGLMTYAELVEVARTWNRDGRDLSNAPKKIEVLDVLDQTAVAKLTAQWGIDYMQLAKVDGKWMIRNVLWQSHPAQ